MFNWLKANPSKQRQKVYEQKLQQAMEAQRSGDIRRYSELMEEAEALWDTSADPSDSASR